MGKIFAILLIFLSLDKVSLALPKVTECKGALEASANSCQGVTSAGCCDPTGKVFWCENNKLYCLDCSTVFPSCGWNPDGYYDCGQTPFMEDPKGENPIACGGCPVGCGKDALCSPECPGLCGKCPNKGEICLEDGSCYKLKCDGMECGLDPMGFSCGVCKEGYACVTPLNKCMPLPSPCVPHKGPGCGGCACEACVCEKHPSCCKENWDIFCATVCEKDCKYNCSPCPLNPKCGEIKCGEYCGITCGTCGDGEVCVNGKCCKTECAGKECGQDGCGGECGKCKGFDECVNGKCVACTPKCAGKECGDDGCGGKCGQCPEGEYCVGGKCKKALCSGICGSKDVIDCGEGCQCECNNSCFKKNNCCDKICETCPQLKGCCVPQCEGKQCGPDGCGGFCGYCGMGKHCVQGKCEECSCEGKVCGDDGCGKLCGFCTFGTVCKEGICVPCTSDCTGKECGDDGCGWWCGEGCPPGLLCVDFKCGCKPHFETGCCGNDICWYDSCGNPGEIITECGELKCIDGGCKVCKPDCEGKECGDDGCGGSCGICSPDKHCEKGKCILGVTEIDVLEDVSNTNQVDHKKKKKDISDMFGGCNIVNNLDNLAPLVILLLTLFAIRTRFVIPCFCLLYIGSCSSNKGVSKDINIEEYIDAKDDINIKDDFVKELPKETTQEIKEGVKDTEEIPLTYDCNNLYQGPFKLEKVEFAIASEDIAFDSEGNLVGSDMEKIFKTKFQGKPKVWIPDIHTRAGLRFLPNGTLVVCDDQKGQLRAFEPDGSERVILQGLQYPNGLTIDMKGYIYLTEHNANRVLRIHPYTGAYTVLTKKIPNPNGIAFNPDYTSLYIGSFGSGWIYKMTISPDGIPGKLIEWVSPAGPGGLLDGIAVDACGNVYVCEYGNTDIYRIHPSGSPVVKIVHGVDTYLPNMQWGVGYGWDPLSLYIPDGWKASVWRLYVGVPSAPRPYP